MFLAAVIQLNCTSNEQANWESARSLIERAAGHGARFAATPENTNYLGPHDEKVRRAEPLDGPTCGRFSGLARRLGIHLLLGSFNERSDEPHRCYNTSVFFGPDGAILGTYRKMHLFDVDVPGGVRFAESDTCKPGEEVTVVDTPLGRFGLSICYDLRFPVWSRNRDDYDLLVYVANWPDRRHQAQHQQHPAQHTRRYRAQRGYRRYHRMRQRHRACRYRPDYFYPAHPALCCRRDKPGRF